MNEDTIRTIIRNRYGMHEAEETEIRKYTRRYSTIWTATIRSHGKSTEFFIKQSDQDLHLQAELWHRAEELFQDDKTYVPLDVMYISDHNIIISRKSNFPTLSKQIAWKVGTNPFGWYRQTNHMIEMAGKWLRQYHDSETSTGSISEPLLTYVKARKRYLEVLPESIREGFLDLVRNCPDHQLAVVHGDFSPSNILSDGQSFSVIDFGITEWHKMSPFWDIATLTIALERAFLFGLRNPLRWVPSLRRQVISNFTESYGDTFSDNSRVWQACCATRHFAQLARFVDSNTNDPRIHWHTRKLDDCLSL